MRKTLAALAAAATIAVATIATPTAAEARWWHGGFRGPGPFFGGLFAGAVIAGALAPRYYGYPYYSCVRTYWNGWTWVRYRVC
jgi:hypothetical protein